MDSTDTWIIMAEIVSSAVVQETVSQVLSGLVKKYEEKEESNANRNLERLEMAQIRLEAALETSEKWQITDASLLRWRRKLKRAAQECDETLHKCKQRILEDEQMQQEVRNSSLPTRIAHATKSFVSSVLYRNNKKLSKSIAQRFECTEVYGTEASLIEKVSMRTWIKFGKLERQDQDLVSWARVISHLLELWGAHAPVQLRSTLVDWLQKEKERQVAAPQLQLKLETK
ncbi:hypothetical protein HU200_027944 [Digitaria exilis]|uniref:Rx N-terminal domain-containing protein n=1 Tax=Digitaria exilis TaxID=1010633 RepID=A0A835BT62_9POAL|nr:hypothetical protein HU200_027944 [Digitaria exilis]